MPSLFDISYHGTNADLDELLKKGYRFGRKSGNSLPFQWGGQKAYVTPNANLASTYGKNRLPVITSGGARSFPGGSVGSKGFTFGKEVPLTAKQFDKGAELAKKLQGGAYPNSKMANYARTTMSQAPIKQSFLKGIMPTIMNMGSKMARFPNPITTVLQGLAPTALADGMLDPNAESFITWDKPAQSTVTQPTPPTPPLPSRRNETKFSPTRSTAIKGGRGGRGNVGQRRRTSSPSPVFKSYGPPNRQRY